MNSSSAFSNALTVPPIQPANHMTPARNSLDDDGSPAFKRALADVRAEQAQPTEPSAKKLAADKPAKSKVAPDNAVDTAVATEKSISCSPKKAAETEVKEDTGAVTDEAKKVESPEPLLALDAIPVPQVPLDPSAAAAITELAGTAEGALPSLGNPAQDAAMAALATATTEIPSSAALTPQMAQQEEVPAAIAELIDPKATAVAVPAQLAAANPAAVAAPPEAIAAAGLAPLKNTEVKLAATTGDATADDALLVSDDQPASTDPKAVFEKMLQAIAGNAGANGNASGEPQKNQDLAATITALAAASGSDSPMNATGIESLSRGPEAQLPSARSFVVQTAIPVNLGQPTWSQAVGEKVLWLAAQNVQSAEIILDPPEVGPMQIKVSVHQEQTSISFTSHNAGVRELLDQSLGRLRDMFNEQGLNLVNVDVSDKSFQRQQGDGSEQQGQGARGEQQEEETLQAVTSIVQQRLVDHYA